MRACWHANTMLSGGKGSLIPQLLILDRHIVAEGAALCVADDSARREHGGLRRHLRRPTKQH